MHTPMKFIRVLRENRKFHKFINFYIYGTEEILNEVMCEQRIYISEHHHCWALGM